MARIVAVVEKIGRDGVKRSGKIMILRIHAESTKTTRLLWYGVWAIEHRMDR
jgi:hypothetical protein